MGKDKGNSLSFLGQQKLLEKLLKFRFKKHGPDLIKVEVYDQFDGDTYNAVWRYLEAERGLRIG
jgi:hypothetical protein